MQYAFFCGQPDHLIRLYLGDRLAELYDQEKRKPSHTSFNTHKAAKIQVL
jgi:hypothetical protein